MTDSKPSVLITRCTILGDDRYSGFLCDEHSAHWGRFNIVVDDAGHPVKLDLDDFLIIAKSRFTARQLRKIFKWATSRNVSATWSFARFLRS